jgi:hypothetical protein
MSYEEEDICHMRRRIHVQRVFQEIYLSKLKDLRYRQNVFSKDRMCYL